MRLIYEKEKCVGCGNCVVVCPLNLSLDVRAMGGKGGGISVKVKDGYAEVEECPLCGICVRFCPFGALRIETKPVKEFERSEEIFEEVKEEVEEKKVEKKVEITYKINRELLRRIQIVAECMSTGLMRRLFEEDVEITPAEMRNLIEVFERRGDVFGILEEQIISNDFCSLCGACVASCGKDAIEIRDVPVLVKECSNCASCIVRCPKTSLIDVEPNGEVGVYLAKGKFGDEKRHGVITSLLAYALDKGVIECAIVTDGEKPILATKTEELLNCAEKFSIVPNVSMLKEALKIGFGSIGAVGVPCNVLAFRKFERLGTKQLKLIISVFCPRGSYKGKVPLACKLCTDFYGEFADISVSHITEEGWALLITRTEFGEELVKSASREGYLRIGDPGDEILQKFRKFAEKKKETGEKNRQELLKKFDSFEKAVQQLGALNVRYLSGGRVW